MLGYGRRQPTWDPCCGQPRRGAPSLFAGGPERLICTKCGSWCDKPSSGEAPKAVAPEWWKRMWAS